MPSIACLLADADTPRLRCVTRHNQPGGMMPPNQRRDARRCWGMLAREGGSQTRRADGWQAIPRQVSEGAAGMFAVVCYRQSQRRDGGKQAGSMYR